MSRKELIKKLEEKYNTKAKYLGAPSLAYEITIRQMALRIDREGNVFNSDGTKMCVEELLNLDDGGIYYESTENTAQENAASDTEPTAGTVSDTTITIPIKGHSPKAFRNFANMIFSNQQFIKKALGLCEDIITQEFVHQINIIPPYTPEEFKNAYNETPQLKGEALFFDFDENKAVIRLKLRQEKQDAAVTLFLLMYKTAQERRYVTFRPKAATNEKYTFRTWLLSLGMKGSQYKSVRKELLKELKGNSAFKNPRKEEGLR